MGYVLPSFGLFSVPIATSLGRCAVVIVLFGAAVFSRKAWFIALWLASVGTTLM